MYSEVMVPRGRTNHSDRTRMCTGIARRWRSSTDITVGQDAVALWLSILQADDGRNGWGVEFPEGLPAERLVHVILLLQWLQLHPSQADVRARRGVAASEVHRLHRVGSLDVLVRDA